MAKSLFIFLFFFFSFSFILDLLHRRECRKVSHHKCHIVTVIWQEVTVSHHIMSHDQSHDRCGKIVHRPCSSCISSVENLTGTPSSSLCQMLNKETIGLIPVIGLWLLTLELDSTSQAPSALDSAQPYSYIINSWLLITTISNHLHT